MHQIKCGNCSGTHTTAREVHACYFFPQQATEPRATERQKAYIRDLGGTVVAGMTKTEASNLITRLKRIPSRRPMAANTQQAGLSASSPSLITPLAMIEMLRDGRYAVRPDENQKFMFIKVWRPSSGKKKGCLIISTQHSDKFKECIVKWPSGQWSVYDSRPDSNLLLIVADPITATRAYAREKQCCCKCGRELTDGRSIWYGVGPECEKDFPEIINARDEEVGRPYRLGDSIGAETD